MDLKQRAFAATLACSQRWENVTPNQRHEEVRHYIQASNAYSTLIRLVAVKGDGQVILSFTEPVAADRRGLLLLDLEQELKQHVDIGLTVWLEPLGDKSALRKLRGIEVKST